VAKRHSPSDLQVALVLLRALNGWNQRDFAEAAGLQRSQISQAETGYRRPTEKTLSRLLATAGVSPSAFRAILAFLQRLRSGEALGTSDGSAPAVLRDVTLALELATANILEHGRGEVREFEDRALTERLCAESELAAARDSERSLDLAGLALSFAERLSGVESSHVQAYAWAHLGNARRVAGDLGGAEAAFLKVRRLWDAGAKADTSLDMARVLDLEASLRRDQRRLGEALKLLDRALDLARTDSAKGRVILKRAFTLEQMGEQELALDALERALPLLDQKVEPRQFFGLQFNRAVNLVHLSRVDEAAALVPGVREMAVRLGNELDLIRVRWLEARVAVGKGDRAEAMEALAWVKKEFAARNIAYDTALASLELAVLYLGEGRTGEVKTLAEEMRPVFQSQGVHREALAALRVFSEAAAREAVTLDLARRLVAYLERARHDPELRFGG
jgi:transcriptional regulator with XRE-family HTH domain